MKRTSPMSDGQKRLNGQPIRQLKTNSAEANAAGHYQRRAISNRFGISDFSTAMKAHLAASINVRHGVVSSRTAFVALVR